MTRLEVELGNLARQLDRQIDTAIDVQKSTLHMIEKLDQRLADEEGARELLAANFRVFSAKLIMGFAVIAGIGETILTIFGPSLRKALNLP